MNLSIPLSTVRCRIFYIKIYWKYERKKNKWVRIQTHWLLIQTHWLRIRGRVLIRGLNNLPILEMTIPLNTVVGITLFCVKTSVFLDVVKSVLWQTPITTLQ